jgi:hypothetical protein
MNLKKSKTGQVLVVAAFTPCFSGVKIKRIMVQGQTGQIVCKILSWKYPTCTQKNVQFSQKKKNP